jgi:hypothetical protein
VWRPTAIGIEWFCGLGSVAGEFSALLPVIAFASLLLGVPVGVIFGRGLADHVGFAGWIPASFAAGASVLVVVPGVVVANAVTPLGSASFVALVATVASIGAVGASARFTWAEA